MKRKRFLTSAAYVLFFAIGATIGIWAAFDGGARGGHPPRAIPKEAVSGYGYLCSAIMVTVIVEHLLLQWQTSRGMAGTTFILVVGVAAILWLVVLFIWSVVVGIRLARIGRAVRYANAVCIRCGFAVTHVWHLGCPVCGADACPTICE